MQRMATSSSLSSSKTRYDHHGQKRQQQCGETSNSQLSALPQQGHRTDEQRESKQPEQAKNENPSANKKNQPRHDHCENRQTDKAKTCLLSNGVRSGLTLITLPPVSIIPDPRAVGFCKAACYHRIRKPNLRISLKAYRLDKDRINRMDRILSAHQTHQPILHNSVHSVSAPFTALRKAVGEGLCLNCVAHVSGRFCRRARPALVKILFLFD